MTQNLTSSLRSLFSDSLLVEQLSGNNNSRQAEEPVMHEASLMRDLMNKIELLATEQQANKVTRVGIWLGALSHMSADHFREHFLHSSADTIAVDAELDIEVSEDIDDPNAQSLLLKSIEVDT